MITDLFQSPERFGFFQAVRLLERWIALEKARVEHHPHAVAEGGPAQRFETVRFRSSPSLAFPAGEIADVVPDESTGRIDMIVRFFGLAGLTGPLPAPYAALAASQSNARRDRFNEFLDLFHDRLIRLFYESWVKHTLPAAYERATGGDAATMLLRAFIGCGMTRGDSGSVDLALYFCGEFARQARSPGSLERLLREALKVPAKVEEFVGVWLPIACEEQSRLSGDGHAPGMGARLGTDALVGRQVWDMEGTFRIVLGPLSYSDYEKFLPDTAGLIQLSQLVRLFAPSHLQFFVRLALMRDEVPALQLLSSNGKLLLGLNTWLQAGAPSTETWNVEFLLGPVPN